MNLAQEKQCVINSEFYQFINDEILPQTNLNGDHFWYDFNCLISDFSSKNSELLNTRQKMQIQLDQWHRDNPHFGSATMNKSMASRYQAFLQSIGYLVADIDDFERQTANVDPEISTMAGPQLVVPVSNARFALNAANARWSSLYDAFYGTDVIENSAEFAAQKGFNLQRAEAVINKAKDFLDAHFPLNEGSHHDVSSYLVYYQHLLDFFPNGRESGLKKSCQFIAFDGAKNAPSFLLLKNNGLQVGLQIDRHGKIGATDKAGIDDIQIESALTTIIDFEDSISAVDSEDKVAVYRNWYGLMTGDLSASFIKNGQSITRHLNYDRCYTAKSGGMYRVAGRSLLMVRNVGHLMGTDLIQDSTGNNAPEGIVDALITTLIASIDMQKNDRDKFRNSLGAGLTQKIPVSQYEGDLAGQYNAFIDGEKVESLDQLHSSDMLLSRAKTYTSCEWFSAF